MMNRYSALFPTLFLFASTIAWSETATVDVQSATLVHNASIAMRDGVRLAADLLFPEGKEGPFPVILYRNPYGKEGASSGEGRDLTELGFAVVSQDTRGRGDSEGVWDAFRYEAEDGSDTLEWIGAQDWCDGRIGLTGGSYLGFTQCINAPNDSQYLFAMNPIVPWGNTYHECLYWGGAFRLQLAFFWGGLQHLAVVGKSFEGNWNDHFKKLPLKTWDETLGAGEIGYLRDWIAHPFHDEYWKDHEVGDKIENVTIPALYIGGWYDIFQNGVIDYWNGVRTKSKSEEARKRQHLVMGPWTHGVSPKDGKVGALDFGEHSNIHPRELRFNWFKELFFDEDHGMSNLPPLRLYVMGANVWRDEQEWPLARTEYKELYLGGESPANSVEGGGRLLWGKWTGTHEVDEFVYDPNDPVPTMGGSLLYATAGPQDQSAVEARQDVLVYSTDVLTETVEVTGQVRLLLDASSGAPNTDFTAKLVDVYPGEDGKEIPYNITDGILRASHRLTDTESNPFEPGKVYEFNIDLGYTSNAFLPGHRIRLEVSSSNFPRFDRNPNTGHEFGSDTEMVPANQKVYRSLQYPSHLLLPVIPN